MASIVPYGIYGAVCKWASADMVKAHPKLTGAQLRAARALLNLSAETLAAETKIGLRTIRRAEQENGSVRLTAANAERLIELLECRGVEFLSGEDAGPGVRLRLSPPPKFAR